MPLKSDKWVFNKALPVSNAHGMSGIECVGLALAMMPLAIETAKAYKNGVDSLMEVMSSARLDRQSEEYFGDVRWEMLLLDRQLRDMVQTLPLLQESR